MRAGGAIALTGPTTDRRTVVAFVLLSLLFHALLFTIPLPRAELQDQQLALLPVELLPPPAPRKKPAPAVEKKQIVSPSDVPREEEPDKPTRFLSDRSSWVAKQTVRRGMPRPGTGAPKARRPNPGKAADKEQQEQEKLSKLSMASLFRSPGELVRSEKRKEEEKKKAKEKQAAQSAKKRIDLALAGLGALSPASIGVPDYLPDIRPGQFTLLNAKANRFAPFVRRVGMRVFQHLLIAERRLAEREILSAQGRAVVRAVLGPDGKLVELTTEGLSGSSGLDKTLRLACQKGAFDNNPPKGAQLPDGTYEFLFEARLHPWSSDGRQVGRVDSFLSVRLF